MKPNKFSQNQNQQKTPRPTSAIRLSQSEASFTPCPDEVARRAYFAYENQGSEPGHEVQHWLAAEAAMITEHNQTRTHGFLHHPSQRTPSTFV